MALVVLVVTASLALALPLVARFMIDGIAADDLTYFDRYGLYGLIVAILFGMGSALRYTLVTRLGEKVVVDIRKAVFAHTIGLSQEFFEKVMTGEILSRLNTDTTLVLTVISSSFSVALRSCLLLAGGLAMLFVTSVKLTMMTLVLVPIVLVPVLFLSRHLKSLSRDNQDHMAKGSGNVSEALLAVNAIQANTHEELSKRRFFELSDSYLQSANQRIMVRGLMTMLIISLAFSSVGLVIWIGVRDVIDGTLSAGELTQFVIYSVMVGGTVSSLTEVWGELLRASGAIERLVDLLEVQDAVQDPKTPLVMPDTIAGRLEFNNVSFRYPNRPEALALDEVSFHINPNETVAIVGPSGAGKSSVFQLILRFFDPQSGRVAIDGMDIKSLRRQDFRRFLALVPQDPVIFSASARENIRFGRPEATDKEVEEAAEAGGAHEFLREFPEGYETLLGERGMLLSGGQKQRIAIARAILRNAPILLLDEATSSLDADSEKRVQEALNHFAGKCTMVIIAHRLATVQIADRIMVLDKGQVMAEGTHAELLAEQGMYSRLAQLQFVSQN